MPIYLRQAELPNLLIWRDTSEMILARAAFGWRRHTWELRPPPPDCPEVWRHQDPRSPWPRLSAHLLGNCLKYQQKHCKYLLSLRVTDFLYKTQGWTPEVKGYGFVISPSPASYIKQKAKFEPTSWLYNLIFMLMGILPSGPGERDRKRQNQEGRHMERETAFHQ